MLRIVATAALRRQFLSINVIAANTASSQQTRHVSKKPVNITHLDHLVLTVADIDRTVDFYTSILGMEVTTFKGGRKSLNFGVQKINIHQHTKEFEPKAHIPTPGSADLCFITSSNLKDVHEHLKASNIDVIEGPVERTGAVGTIRSLYFRDPDRNLIEVSNYIEKGDKHK